jgi:hypothetical protein
MGWRIQFTNIRQPTGAFANWQTPASVVLQRNGGVAGSLMTHDGYKRVMQNKYTRDIIMSTSLANLELQHNNAHVWVGGLIWKPECVLSFNMGWRIQFTNIRQPMLKLKTHSGFHELFRF